MILSAIFWHLALTHLPTPAVHCTVQCVRVYSYTVYTRTCKTKHRLYSIAGVGNRGNAKCQKSGTRDHQSATIVILQINKTLLVYE